MGLLARAVGKAGLGLCADFVGLCRTSCEALEVGILIDLHESQESLGWLVLSNFVYLPESYAFMQCTAFCSLAASVCISSKMDCHWKQGRIKAKQAKMF